MIGVWGQADNTSMRRHGSCSVAVDGQVFIMGGDTGAGAGAGATRAVERYHNTLFVVDTGPDTVTVEDTGTSTPGADIASMIVARAGAEAVYRKDIDWEISFD